MIQSIKDPSNKGHQVLKVLNKRQYIGSYSYMNDNRYSLLIKNNLSAKDKCFGWSQSVLYSEVPLYSLLLCLYIY